MDAAEASREDEIDWIGQVKSTDPRIELEYPPQGKCVLKENCKMKATERSSLYGLMFCLAYFVECSE